MFTSTRTVRLVLILILGCLAVDRSVAATRYVSLTGSHTAPYTNWVTAATNLQSALDAAVDGEDIVIGDGDYYPSAEVTVNKGVTLRGDTHRNAFFHGGGPGSNYRCFTIAHSNAVIRRLRIENFDAGAGNGGGVRLTAPGRLTDCTLKYNRAFNGGNVAVEAGADGAEILYSWCANGVATERGGSLYLGADSWVEIMAIGSSDRADVAGGGIYVAGASTVRNCSIINTDANGSGAGAGGGGVYFENGGSLENSTVTRGEAPNASAGGVWVSPTTLVINSIVYGNTASTDDNVNDPGTGTNFVRN